MIERVEGGDASYLGAVWPEVYELVETYGQKWLSIVSLPQVFISIMKGDTDLWLAGRRGEIEIALFAQWELHAHRRNYHILWCGGRGLKHHLQDGLAALEEHACLHSATELVIGGRPGWMRALSLHGYVARPLMVKNVAVCWRM